MLFETPDDTYKAFQRFMLKKEYEKAYRCLEKLLKQFPDDRQLLHTMVDLCIYDWKQPAKSRPWLKALLKQTSSWFEYVLLSQVEADTGNFAAAWSALKTAKELQPKQKSIKSRKPPGQIFSEVEQFIKYRENPVKSLQKLKIATGNKASQPEKSVKKDKAGIKPSVKLKEAVKKHIASPPVTAKPEAVVTIPTYSVPVSSEPFKIEIFPSLLSGGVSTIKEASLLIDYAHLSVQGGFDELLCLNAISGIEKYWYQIETVKKVLKQFHGRALLSDEVGLGKTIEAGMLIKEYFMRGMARNILILTPAPLVSQWREEMKVKFGMEFLTTDDPEFAEDPARFWQQKFIISSINTAKGSKNAPVVSEQFYDLVVVDEAHHLRNRNTLGWKLVNQIQKRFILLLTATPVQNNLIELFNLITLLKPGQFKTEKLFKEEYVMKGNTKAPANKERLRELLRDVMIRNTRSAIDLKLPKRFASTMRLTPSKIEMDIYAGINDCMRRHGLKRNMVNLLLREAGSSPFALKKSLKKMTGIDGMGEIITAVDSLGDISKGKGLLDIVKKNPDDKKLVFTQFISSMDYISELFLRHGIPHVMFRGDMTVREKDEAISSFKGDIPVLISTESGGEGRNMQFCNTIINFDLPWNPMRIEQRIGRLHRIGQGRDVFIFNLSVKGTVEDYIIDILDNKINMFEMVIGEIEPILGYVGEDKDFEEIILDLWLESGDNKGLEDSFEKLGQDMANAKKEYLEAKKIDSEVFGEDYEI